MEWGFRSVDRVMDVKRKQVHVKNMTKRGMRKECREMDGNK